MFIDDLLSFDTTLTDHYHHLREIFQIFKNANMTLNLKKCEIAVTETTWLGHTVSEKGISPMVDSIQAIADMPAPQDVKSLHSILGCFGFFRKYIQGFGVIAASLYHLMKKDVPWDWSQQCQAAFDKLRISLMSAPCLKHVDFSQPFVLAVDASTKALGACLSQYDEDGNLRPCMYIGRSLSPAEKNYSISHLELLAATWAITHLRYYLTGRKFALVSDHRSLKYLFQDAKLIPRLQRYIMILQSYNFDFHHLAGKYNTVPDCLSRLDYKPSEKSVDDILDSFPSWEEVDKVTLPEECLGLPSGLAARSADIHHRPGKVEKKKQAMAITRQMKRVAAGQSGAATNLTPKSTSDNQKIKQPQEQTASDEYVQKQSDNLNNTRPDKPTYKSQTKEQTKVSDSTQATRKPTCAHKPNYTKRSAIIERPAPVYKLPVARDEFQAIQTSDPMAKSIIDYINYRILPDDQKAARAILLREEDYLIMDDGLLYHIWTPNTNQVGKAIIQLFVPRLLIRSVLAFFHDTPASGHRGIHSCLALIRREYYWCGMLADIRHYVDSCSVCQKTKRDRTGSSPLSLYPETFSSFYWCHIDIVDNLTPDKDLKRTSFVSVTCRYTRYVVAWATTNSTAEQIAKDFYDKVCCVFNIPVHITSDRGSAFISNLYKRICKYMGIKESYTTSYRAKANGLAERKQGSIVQTLRALCFKCQDQWAEYLPSAVFAINSSVSAATGYSPHELVFGTPPRVYQTALLDSAEILEDTLPKYRNYIKEFIQKQTFMQENVSSHFANYERDMKLRYDQRAKIRDIRPGDMVVLHVPPCKNPVLNKSKKLSPFYIGPFQVTETPTKNTARLRYLQSGKPYNHTVNLDQLKLIFLGNAFSHTGKERETTEQDH